MRRTLVPFAFLVVLVAACAGLIVKPEAPRVTVADLKLLELSLLEQKYQVKLRVQNPNRFELAVNGFDYEILIDDKPFASGVSNKPVTIPGYGTELVEVEGFGNVGDVLKRLLDFRRGIPDKIHYRLKGHVRLKNTPAAFPFDHSGEFSLTRGGKREAGT